MVERADPSIRFLMIGDLPEELSRAGYSNLTILPAMQLDDLAKQLASCHLGLCLLRELPAMKKAFPAKAYDFIGAGLPMLVGPEGELADAVERMRCGVSFAKVYPEKVAQFIVELKQDYARWSVMRDQTLQHRSDFGRRKLASLHFPSILGELKKMIAKSEHWNLSKVAKLAVCQLIAMGVCLFVTLYHSPTSETLLQVNRERLLFYAASFGGFFLLAGEVSGLFVYQRKSGSWKRIFLTLVSSGLAVLALIILVWIIEFDFVGRFVAIKMLGGLGLLVCLFLALQESLSQGNPWRTVVLASSERKVQIRDYLGPEDAKVAWVDLGSDVMDKDSLLLGCDSEAVELLLIEEEQESEVPVMPLLSSGFGLWE